ncbi:MAG: Tfp pilus assembly protein FimT/FimU [bacterium]
MSKKQTGFTLIEVIVIMVILGILSYVVVANMESTHTKLQYESITKKILSDVRYARELALTQGKGSRVHIDVLNNRYYLKWEDGSYIQNPIGGGNFVVQLGQRTPQLFTNKTISYNLVG